MSFPALPMIKIYSVSNGWIVETVDGFIEVHEIPECADDGSREDCTAKADVLQSVLEQLGSGSKHDHFRVRIIVENQRDPDMLDQETVGDDGA